MERHEQDLQHWHTWKADPNPENLSRLLKQVEPVLYTATKVNQGNLPPAIVQAEAKLQAVKAFQSYDPKRGVKLSTHLTNYMQKVNRLNYNYQEIYSVPEQRRIKFSTYQSAKQHLEDSLQREPTTEELADYLKWSKAEVQRFNAEARTEYSDSQPYASDLGMHDTRDDVLVAYVYNDLSPKNKLLFEHTTGYNGKPILSNDQLCRKLKMTQGQLSYAKAQLRDHVKSVRGGKDH